jgi:hypothetical protein
MADLATKAGAIKKNADGIEKSLEKFKEDFEQRLKNMVELLNVLPTP